MARNIGVIEKLFLICILTAFTGEMYLSPFTSGFRFSFSVSALSLMLIYFKNISVLTATNAVGIVTFLFRTFVYIIGNSEATLESALVLYMPGAIFYSFFGALFELFHIRDKLNKPEIALLFLWLCDSLSNIAEAILRRQRIDYPFEGVVLAIILMGLIRSLITVAIYYVIFYYRNRLEREQKDKKYKELLLFIANLKTELFFLRKSMIDIEEAMKKSYNLYENLRQTHWRDDALLIAKDIHEIKKDYMRVVVGIEKTLSDETQNLCMSMKEIFDVIRENTEKFIHMSGKSITLQFNYKNNFTTREFHQIISVLNNLIINGIEAIGEKGEILVTQSIQEEMCIFTIEDNGEGIDPSDIDLVFEPGFSTKFHPDTGEISTGIGLTHVKHIVEGHFEGKILVVSQKNVHTLFTICIPVAKIMYRKW